MEKKDYRNILRSLSNKKLTKYDFVGFDVETYGKENKFYLGGLFYFTENKKEKFVYFKDKKEMIKFILSSKFRNKIIVASNLGFDLSVLFYESEEWNDLNRLEQGSNTIYADYKIKYKSRKYKIKFIDTFNYVPFSVEKLGSILKIPKLNKPSFIGEKPKNIEEEEELIIYNKRDCEISCLFMYFLQESINIAGGNLKITIASTSFDIWRRNFQSQTIVKEEMRLRDQDIKKFLFKAYYGGRTEVFKKGEFKNLFYYDINSLYPSVMIKKFPLPQSIKEVPFNHISYIKEYDGVTECEVEIYNLNKPFLPYRDNKTKKLLFPLGKFKGVWNNCELKKAIELGYKINKIYKQVIYTKYFYPFKSFVNYFYEKRLEYKKQNSPMELPMKLILNSLYGKFGQKKVKETKILNLDYFTGEYKDFVKLVGDDYYIKDNKVIINNEKDYNGKNVYPILASYVTSYARILMYDYINNDDVIYTDTDSVFIQSEKYENSKELGKMKLEDKFKKGIFVKPKFYFVENELKEIIKIKGLNKATKKDFFKILNNKEVSKIKFSKIKESIRRGINPNTKLEIKKLMKLEDDKRIWSKYKDILISKPLIIQDD